MFAAKAFLTLFPLVLTVVAQESSSSGSASGSATGTASGTVSGSAANPTSTAGIPPCVLTCSTQAAAQVGCSITDISCICTNQEFQTAAGQCIQSTCSAEDQAAALQQQAQQCGAASASGSASPSVTGSATTAAASPSTTGSRPASSSPTGSATRPASSSAAAATTSQNAANKVVFGTQGLVAFGVAAAGALVGAGLVL